MASIFEQTIVPQIDFSNFDLSETNLLTANFGQLIPCYVKEVLPNDVFTLGASSIVNFAPMVAPMYQDVHVSMHFFYVPLRLLFDDIEPFLTHSLEGQALSEDEIPEQPGISIAKLSEYFDILADESLVSTTTGWQGTLLDYFGLPNQLWVDTDDTADMTWASTQIISDFLLRGYFKIWFDYYRDENLQAYIKHDDNKDYLMYKDWKLWRAASHADDTSLTDEEFVRLNNGFMPRYRAYRKDYFTACLPSPQKGEPVSIGLTGTAPVTFPNNVTLGAPGGFTPAREGVFAQFSSDTNLGDAIVTGEYAQTGAQNYRYLETADGSERLIGFQGQLIDTLTQKPLQGTADLSAAISVTVEQLREAFAVQEILESLSIHGSRWTEFLKGNFGVTPDDYKLQRPQFLGGLVTPVQVQQVLQQSGYSGSDNRDMTGYAAGRAFAGVGGRVFRQRFKEHGYIIGIMSIMPKAYYYQGIPKHFMRKDMFDYYLPQTAHLGEQGVSNMELFFDNGLRVQDNEAVFGYIPRWAEYKTSTNGIHGDFRGNLNYYHMARTFSNSSKPTLSEAFISTSNVPTRPFAVWQSENPGVNHLCWVNCYFKVIASRPMPYHSIPKVL